jgi:ubiquinone/menaquinone biosynthesis C-methylase UbiE
MYDLSPARLKEAAALQVKHGVAERADLICADAFTSAPEESFDLVYWASSLHHMPDAYVALEWSWKALKPGGVLAMWEFIGPTRWQFSDEHLDLMNRFRAALPGNIQPGKPLRRKTVSQMIARDPSEAADSGSILPALNVQFPAAEVIMLGGGMYGFGMSGIWPRLTSEHGWVFDMVMAMDFAMTDHQMHACAFARKPS